MIITETSSSELSSSELRYRRLFEAARDGILIVDPETRKIVDVNPFMEKFLGYPFDYFIGKELYEIGLLKDEAASQAAFRELQTTGYIRYDDLPLETKDGKRVDVEFVSNLYQEDKVQVIQCNIRDISTRRLADDALRQSEERFKLVTHAVSDVVWDRNLVTNSLWWSDGFLTTFGYDASEIGPGIESWSNRIHPEERGRVVDGIRRAIATKEDSWSAEYRFLCKDGSYAFVQDNGYIIRDATGRGLRMVGGLRDLTEQKKVEAQHLRAQRMEGIGTLASGIAHDLNNVLSPIMMSIELLKADSGNEAERGTILETIQLSCRRGADLVRQVLSFARGLDGQRIPIRLKHLIDDLNWIIRETFPRNIRIQFRVSDDLWPVEGDPTQLHQVLLNLTVNARDAMPRGGVLSLTATNITLDDQNIGTTRQARSGNYVLLQVSDTGHGIPKEIRESIFKPFFTTKEGSKGTGFGLATVLTIVEGHGGFVDLQSEIGHGTVFSIYVPANPELRIGAVADTPSDLPEGHGELILVVDDELSIRSITQRMLEAFGYRVITARDGTEAVTQFSKQAQDIALVITDMMMPAMDGTATIAALRQINPSVEIILVSGLEANEEMITAGALHFLAKPYSAHTLLQLVRDVLERTPVVSC